jgi:hypothetical protein
VGSGFGSSWGGGQPSLTLSAPAKVADHFQGFNQRSPSPKLSQVIPAIWLF